MKNLSGNVEPIAWGSVPIRIIPMRLSIAFIRDLEPLGSFLSIAPALTPSHRQPASLAPSQALPSGREMTDVAELYHLAKFTLEMVTIVTAAANRLERMMAERKKPVQATPNETTLDSIVKWSQFGLQIFPMLIQAIMLAEQTIGSGKGETKKALVMGAVSPFTAGERDSDAAQSAIAEAIDNSVATLNSAGKLPPSQLPAAPKG